jgi:hypothetical protein
MLRSGVALMQQARKGMAQVLPFAHRGLEQRFLNIARHVAPNGHRRLAQQYGKSLLFGHIDPPAFRRLTEFKVPKAGIDPMSHPIRLELGFTVQLSRQTCDQKRRTPSAKSRPMVTAAESSSEPRHPSLFEKNRNIPLLRL